MTTKLPKAFVKRTEGFSSAHRLHSNKLSAEKNKEIFGKCNHVHGHNYKIIVTLYGEIDPITGMVMDIARLKLIMKEELLDNLDHKYIDEDVAYFKDVVSTTENLAVYAWKQMQAGLGDQASLLYEVEIFETDKNVVTYKGDVE